MRNLLPLLILPTMLFSCSKESQVPKYPIEMTFDSIKVVAAMRVFTTGGNELDAKSDKGLITGFLDRDYTDITPDKITYYPAKFTEPVAMNYEGPKFTFYRADSIRYVVNIIDVKKIEAVTIMKSSVTNPVKDDPFAASDLFSYKYDINKDGSYNYQYVVHTNSDKSLEVSLLYYKLVRYDDHGKRTQLAFGKVHNEFNLDFIKSLGSNDTLAVKAYRLVYSAK